MAAQQNLFRSLKLIRLLKQRLGKTLDQLAQILACTPRHVRRFMETLEEVGYCIDKEGKQPPRFYIFDDERQQQAKFTEEEAQLLQQALATSAVTNPLLAPLRQKIYQHSTLFPLADSLINQHQGLVIARLAEAIRDRRQVWLLRYHSVNSNSISDRLVEPHSFSDAYSQLTVYEPSTSSHKTFKTQRIEAVELLDLSQTQPPAEILTDAFNWQVNKSRFRYDSPIRPITY